MYSTNKINNDNLNDNKSENKTKLLYDFNNENLNKISNEIKSVSTVKSSNAPESQNNIIVINNNQFDHVISKKIMNLEMNNDDADEIFNMFTDNKIFRK
jgi:hypothetical protein